MIQSLRRSYLSLIDMLPILASCRPRIRSIFVLTSLDTEDLPMALAKRYTNKHAKAIRRQRLNAKARHQRQHQQAQRAINALQQALHDLGLPENLVIEIAGRLHTQKKLLGKVFGLMFPTLFGCTSAYELTRVRGWDKNVPS